MARQSQRPGGCIWRFTEPSVRVALYRRGGGSLARGPVIAPTAMAIPKGVDSAQNSRPDPEGTVAGHSERLLPYRRPACRLHARPLSGRRMKGIAARPG